MLVVNSAQWNLGMLAKPMNEAVSLCRRHYVNLNCACQLIGLFVKDGPNRPLI